jgi:hypothetical protein
MGVARGGQRGNEAEFRAMEWIEMAEHETQLKAEKLAPFQCHSEQSSCHSGGKLWQNHSGRHSALVIHLTNND